MGVSTSGDMAILVYLAGLIAPRRQPQPGAHRARSLEVRWILDGGYISGGCDRSNAGDRHQQLTLLVSTRFGEELSPQPCCLEAQVTPGFK